MPDPRNFLFNSNYKTDQIIGVISSDDVGTITVPANSFSLTSFPTGINDTTLFDYVFTADGSSDLAPAQGFYLTDPTAGGITALFTSVYMRVTSRPGYVDIDLTNNDTTASHAVSFTIVLLAKKNQGLVDVQPIDSNFTFNTSDNYLKVAFEDVVPFTAPVGGSPFTNSLIKLVDHALEYIPMFRAYIEDDKVISLAGDNDGNAYNGYTSFCQIDEQSLNLLTQSWNVASARPGYIHYRVYYDS